jgi:glycosyltransferase involved in cell wall biosynthesis
MPTRTARGKVVTLVVPAFNEAGTLLRSLQTVSQYMDTLRPHFAWNMVVVDDGSTDGTFDVIRAFAEAHSNVVAVRHSANRGLAEALKTAFARCTGDYIVTIDSDLTYSADHIGRLLDALEASNAAIVTASPYMKGGHATGVPFVRLWLSILGNKFLSLAAHGKLATLTCMVRAYDASRLSSLIPEGHARDFNAEIVFQALRRHAPVEEIPGHLDWSGHAKRHNARVDWRRLFRRVLATFRIGFENRPSLWLAIPGIVPGLLPIVAGILLLARASVQTIAIATAATFVVQMLSLLIVSWQATALVATRRSIVRSSPPFVTARSNDA